jgi:ribose transport system ATP-binding protein
MKGISKDYPGVNALINVDFVVMRGEIHGLVGQNGAGKSTLVKILAGDIRCDRGYIELAGEEVSISEPRDAIDYGVSIVYQDLSLLPNLSVADNIFLGREEHKAGVINEKSIIQRTRDFLELLGIVEFEPEELVEELNISQCQLVEIAKALSYESKILILDEPTSALTVDESERLFRIMKKLKDQGIAIIYISHKIREILDNCDRGTILKDGKVVGIVDINETTEDKIIEMMIGQSQEKFYYHKDVSKQHKKPSILEVEDLSVEDKFRHVTFSLKQGEIIGITGVLGSGIYELGRALFGIQKNVNGIIKIRNKPVKINSPTIAILNGLGLLSENRKDEGLFLDLNVLANISMPSLFRYRYPIVRLLNRGNEKKDVVEITKKVNVIMHSLGQKVVTLSGGNQQKVILARWLLRDLDILIFIEPTIGIDVGSKREIYKLLSELSRVGKGIVIISIDFMEILELSNRILVMREGELIKTYDDNKITEDELLQKIHEKKQSKN